MNAARDEMLQALRTGDWIAPRPSSNLPLIVTAADLRHILLDVSVPDPRGLRIKNITIVGPLDLSGFHWDAPIALDHCVLDHPIDLTSADLLSFSMTECEAPAMLANNLTLKGDLNLGYTKFSRPVATPASTTHLSTVWLCEAVIGGRVLMRGSKCDGPEGRAIQADRMRVGGTVRIVDGFRAKGEVRLIGAQIGGSLDLSEAVVSSHDVAIDLADADIGGSLFLIPLGRVNRPRAEIDGRVELGNARVRGLVMIDGARISAPREDLARYNRVRHSGTSRVAVSAPRFQVDGDLFVLDAAVDGCFDLRNSTIKGDFLIEGGKFSNPSATAINLPSSTIDGSYWIWPSKESASTAIEGSIYAPGISVQGALEWKELVMTQPHPKSGTSVTLNHGHFSAPLVLGNCSMAGLVRIQNTDLEGELKLEGVAARGLVLNRLRTRESLLLKDLALEVPERDGNAALDVSRAQVDRVLRIEGEGLPNVNLEGASVGHLEMPLQQHRVALRGVTFTSLTVWDEISGQKADELTWIDRQEPFAVSPYSSLAESQRQVGKQVEAERILMRVARRSRSERPWNASEAFYDRLVGFGYRPLRLLFPLGATMLLLSLVFSTPFGYSNVIAVDPGNNVIRNSADINSARSCGNGTVRCFDAATFAIDTVVPLLDLGQRTTWYPNTAEWQGRVLRILIVLSSGIGWIVVSTLVLTLGRLARSTTTPT